MVPAASSGQPLGRKVWNPVSRSSLHQSVAGSGSTNWSGQVDTGTQFTGVRGYWTVPSVDASTSPKYTSTWTGIGGYGITELIQTGTTEATTGGSTQYWSWYELLPTSSVPITAAVYPGDEMQAAISQNSVGTWSLQIEDVTEGWRFAHTFSYSAGSASSAEWITERPELSTGFATLANYQSTRFSHLGVVGSSLGTTRLSRVYMVESGMVVSYPSRVTTTTTENFTNRYVSTPTVSSVTPIAGPTAGGTDVTINGTYLVTGLVTSVAFGGVASPAFSVNGNGSVTATAPGEARGTVDVTVTSADGTSAVSSADEYTYVPPPAVSSLAPSTGPQSGGTSVTITGVNLTGATSVRFGATAVSFTVTSATAITATSPAETGAVNVTVTTTGGTSVVEASDTFTSLTPSSGGGGGGGGGGSTPTTPGPSTSTGTTSRIYGSTSDATAAYELEHQFVFSTGKCPATGAVVLATDATYADALSSAYLARYLGTGTLLTPPTSLSPVTLTAIHEEGITKVYVVGGPLAISTAVVGELEATPADSCGGGSTGSADIQVTRIWGATQYTTAEKIARTPPASNVGTAAFSGAYGGLNSAGGDGRYNDTAGQGSAAPSVATALSTAILATGKGFQDAMSASTMAYAERFPILLTTPSALSSQTSAAIGALGIRQVVVMGGQLAVSNSVIASLENLGLSVLRVAGATCSGTSVELAGFEAATTAGGEGLGWRGTGALTVARGNGFTDGLAGAVVAADGPSAASLEPLVLTLDPTVVGPALAAFLHTAGTLGIGGVRVTYFTILGGPLAITTSTVSAMEADL